MTIISSFSRLSNIVSENFPYLGNYYSYSKSENGIRWRIKFPSSDCRHISPEVDGLASGGHRTQNCFWAKYFTSNNFFLLICTAITWVASCLSGQDKSNYKYVNLERSTSFLVLRSTSKGNLTRSCCISFDASEQQEHFKTCPRSVCHSNQKL